MEESVSYCCFIGTLSVARSHRRNWSCTPSENYVLGTAQDTASTPAKQVCSMFCAYTVYDYTVYTDNLALSGSSSTITSKVGIQEGAKWPWFLYVSFQSQAKS